MKEIHKERNTKERWREEWWTVENADKRLNNGRANCRSGGGARDKRTDDANPFGRGADIPELDGKRGVSAPRVSNFIVEMTITR